MKGEWRIILRGQEVSEEDWKKVEKFLKENNIVFHEHLVV